MAERCLSRHHVGILYTNTHVFTQLFKEPDRFDGDDKFAED